MLLDSVLQTLFEFPLNFEIFPLTTWTPQELPHEFTPTECTLSPLVGELLCGWRRGMVPRALLFRWG